jgi:hypothetical protein
MKISKPRPSTLQARGANWAEQIIELKRFGGAPNGFWFGGAPNGSEVHLTGFGSEVHLTVTFQPAPSSTQHAFLAEARYGAPCAAAVITQAYLRPRTIVQPGTTNICEQLNMLVSGGGLVANPVQMNS